MRALQALALSLVWNPIMIRELRAGVRRRNFLMTHYVLLILAGAATFVACLTAANLSGPVSGGSLIFCVFFCALAILLYLMLPAFACTGITAERERHSFDLVLTSTLTAFDLVAGKIMAAVLLGLMILVSTLPLAALTYLYGGLEIKSILGAYGLLALQVVFVSVYGTYVSAISKTTRKAISSAYASLLVMSVAWMFFHGFFLTQIFRERFFDIPVSSDFHVWTLFWDIMLVYSLFCILVVLTAVNRLKPPQANRTTALRIFGITAVGLIAAAIALHLYLYWPAGVLLMPMSEDSMVMLVALGAFGLFFIFAFSLSDPLPSARVQREGRRWQRWPRRLLGLFHETLLPGPDFALMGLILTLACWAALAIPLMNFSDWNRTVHFGSLTALILLHIVLIGAVGRLVRLGLGRLPSAFILVAFMIVVHFLTCLPYVTSENTRYYRGNLPATETLSFAQHSSIRINPALAFSHSFNTAHQPTEHPPLIAHFLVYGALFLALEVAGRWLRRRKHKAHLAALSAQGLL